MRINGVSTSFFIVCAFILANAVLAQSPTNSTQFETTTLVPTTNSTEDPSANLTTPDANSTTPDAINTTTTATPTTVPAETTTTIPDMNTTSATPITTTPSVTTTASPTTTTTVSTTTTIEPVVPTTNPYIGGRKFDGPSFIGGIVLSLGLIAIGYVGYKFYRARTDRNYHTLLETVHM